MRRRRRGRRAPDLTLALALSFGLGMSAVGIAGIGAAVAIPAFLRFSRRAKTSEARVNLSSIGMFAQFGYMQSSTKAEEKKFPCEGQGWVCAPKAAPAPMVKRCTRWT
ncbi:MAG: hypothetical protein H6728_16150 [Myxococcales bacterium]|nr:hypothetical protein [Myxococcales bacterium]